MVRCPNCRKTLAEPIGGCPHCGHDLDKHTWLLGSVEFGRARRRMRWAGLAVAAMIALFVAMQLR